MCVTYKISTHRHSNGVHTYNIHLKLYVHFVEMDYFTLGSCPVYSLRNYKVAKKTINNSFLCAFVHV